MINVISDINKRLSLNTQRNIFTKNQRIIRHSFNLPIRHNYIYLHFKHIDICIMEFKKLEIKTEGSWLRRTISSKHFKKSMIFIILGAVVGFGYFYFTEGKFMENMSIEGISKSILFGGFIGFFITNSPCTRGRY